MSHDPVSIIESRSGLRHVPTALALPVMASLAWAALGSAPLWTAPFWAVSAALALSDADGDLVPDAFDNCSVIPNGPNEASNQVDSDLDGYGNACDPDYNDDFQITTLDYGVLVEALTEPGGEADHDGNGVVTITDFAVFLERFQTTNAAPGPSGLACAGTLPCTP